MSRAERERHAYDEDALRERSHRAHMRFWHVFECPNTRRANRLYERTLARAAAGARALELGCARGGECRRAHEAGAAYVLGIDVARGYLAEAQACAVPGRLEFVEHDLEQPIAGRFDVIFGSAVLHHLDYRPVLERLYTDNLSPGGLMLFREPLGANLLIRLWWRVGTRAHSDDERPLFPGDLAWMRARFPRLRVHGVNYLSLPAGILTSLLTRRADNPLLQWCDRADRWLEERCTWLVPRFRHAVIMIEKPAR